MSGARRQQGLLVRLSTQDGVKGISAIGRQNLSHLARGIPKVRRPQKKIGICAVANALQKARLQDSFCFFSTPKRANRDEASTTR